MELRLIDDQGQASATLWAAAGAAAVHRRRPLSRGTVAVALVLAALPDVMHLLPIAAWWALGDGSFAAVRGYALASKAW